MSVREKDRDMDNESLEEVLGQVATRALHLNTYTRMWGQALGSEGAELEAGPMHNALTIEKVYYTGKD